MTRGSDAAGVLRVRERGEQRVTPLELFFDLVYVFAVTQLSHLLLDHPSLGGALQTLFLLLVVWWAWQYTAWFTNWFDPDTRYVRLVLVAVMLASLVMSAAIPAAFGERGLMFALAYVAIQAGRTAFAVLALGASHPLGGVFWRVLAWFAASGVLWVAGGLSEGWARLALWLLALAVDYAGPVARYRTPRLGSSRTEEWTIEGAHLAERCQLFVIIALGESIIVTGSTFADLEASTAANAAFAVAFVGSAALWWTYLLRPQRPRRRRGHRPFGQPWQGSPLGLRVLPHTDNRGDHRGGSRRRAGPGPPRRARDARLGLADPRGHGAVPRRAWPLLVGRLGARPVVPFRRGRRLGRARAVGPRDAGARVKRRRRGGRCPVGSVGLDRLLWARSPEAAGRVARTAGRGARSCTLACSVT